jgi:hypothetical protein
MKFKLLATGQSPDHYTFDGETITAHQGGLQESVDLSALEQGDRFDGIEPEVLTLPGSQIIRDAYRDEHGELHVTLCQAAGNGHWRESLEYDASEYVPGRRYIRAIVNGELIEPTWPEEGEDNEA